MTGARDLKKEEFLIAVKQAVIKLARLVADFYEIQFPYFSSSEDKKKLFALYKALLQQKDFPAILILFKSNPPSRKRAWRRKCFINESQVILNTYLEDLDHKNILRKLENLIAKKYEDDLSKKYLQREMRLLCQQEEKSQKLFSLSSRVMCHLENIALLLCDTPSNVQTKLATLFAKKPNLSVEFANDLVLAILNGQDILDPGTATPTLHPQIDYVLDLIVQNYLNPDLQIAEPEPFPLPLSPTSGFYKSLQQDDEKWFPKEIKSAHQIQFWRSAKIPDTEYLSRSNHVIRWIIC